MNIAALVNMPINWFHARTTRYLHLYTFLIVAGFFQELFSVLIFGVFS